MARVTKQRPYSVLAGVGAGAGAALALLLVMAGLRYFFKFPTIPELMLSPLVLLLGGEAFSAALDTLYYAGRPLLFTLMLEGTLLLGVVLGLLYAWVARPNRATGRRLPLFDGPWGGVLYGLLIGLLLNTVFLFIVGQPVFADRAYGLYAPSDIPLWAGLMLLALVFGVTLHSLLPTPPAPVPVTQPDGSRTLVPAPVMSLHEANRRHFLRIAGGTLLAVFGGVGFLVGGTVLNQGGVVVNAGAGAGAGEEPESANGSSEPARSDTPTPESIAQAQSTLEPTLEPTLEATSMPQPPAATETPGPLPTEATVASDAPPILVEPVSPEEIQALATDTAMPPTDTPVAPTSTRAPRPTGTPVRAAPAIQVAEITPTDKFYRVSKNFFDPSPSSNGWKLEVKGLVRKPYSLTYEELTALRAIEVTTGMMCISNPVGGGLIGNTTWKGVRMADLLKRASVIEDQVVDVVLRAADDYADSFPYKKALDPDVMVVWEMGGKRLEASHGFPARVLVPGIYGMKHVKWLHTIELVDQDFKGYWQQPSQGWSDPAPVNTMSRIDYPAKGMLDMTEQVISGVAFAGDRSISKVEVSTDGGKTWNEAYVKPPLSGTSWAVWGYKWKPTRAGKYTVMARAYDGQGKAQNGKKADPFPNGATGYHTVSYQVR